MIRRLLVLLAVAVTLTQLCWADAVPADKLSGEEQQRALDLDKAKMFADKEKDLLTSQNELAKAKVAAATPATASGVNPLSGAVTGANNMTFAMYMISLEGLERVAQAVCNDLKKGGFTDVFVTTKDVVEAAAKDEAATRAREQLKTKLGAVRTEVELMTNRLKGEAGAPKISAASLAAVASGIDIAAGLVKGAAGLAGLFKSERTIQASDNLLSAGEVSASLSMCRQDNQGNMAAPAVNYVDNDITTLTAKIGQIGNEVNQVSVAANALDRSLDEMLNAAAELDKEIANTTKAKDNKKLAALENRKAPVNYEAFKIKATGLVAQAQAYVDAVYQVDSTSGLSPLIVTAQFRALKEQQSAKKRLVLTLLKSSGYILTTKRLLLNDRVDYAGGVAVRASVVDVSGNMVYDRIFYRDSGWIRADFDTSKETVKRQNF